MASLSPRTFALSLPAAQVQPAPIDQLCRQRRLVMCSVELPTVRSIADKTHARAVGSRGLAERAAFGASRPLARVPAKVPSLNPQRSLRHRGGNRSSCPKPAIRVSKAEPPQSSGNGPPLTPRQHLTCRSIGASSDAHCRSTRSRRRLVFLRC
jgi:hypothetical protein